MNKVKPSSLANLFFFFSFLSFCFIHADQSVETAFTNIYNNGAWGHNNNGEAHSGGGSTLASTSEYRQFLQDFFKANNIHSVVDVGCGDWEFSRVINWSGINYVGCDVVQSVINENQKKYSSENINFKHGDGITMNLPPADLLICKDVLQHLPNEDVSAFILQFPKYKYILITNDTPGSLVNEQTHRGGYRPIDLTRPPFSVDGVKVLTFRSGPFTKQVLLIKK